MLLTIVIVALCVAQFAAIRQVREVSAINQRLSAENEKLRAEAGYLQVDDPDKVAVLRVPELDELTWRWKVFLPKGKWSLNCLTQSIPSEGVPNGASVGPVDGGREVLMSATVRQGADGKWQFRAKLNTAQIGNPLDESHRLIAPRIHPAIASGFSGQSTDIAGDELQESFDPEQPIVLIRLRAHEVVELPGGGARTKVDPKSSDGIMVWLTRKP